MAVTSRVYTIEGAQRALRSLPRELQKEMRKASKDIAGDLATHAAARARSQPGVAVHVAPTIKARTDRYPVVQMGGNGRLPSGGVVGDVWGGSEFGSRRYRQFQPFAKGGYFMFPTVRDRSDEALKQWLDALQKSLDAI